LIEFHSNCISTQVIFRRIAASVTGLAVAVPGRNQNQKCKNTRHCYCHASELCCCAAEIRLANPSLAPSLQHHEAEWAGESRDAGAHGSFAVNSGRRDQHEAQRGGGYGSTQLGIVALRRSWREIFLWKTGKTHKRNQAGEKEHIRDAHVEFNQALSGGKGLKMKCPPNLAHTLPMLFAINSKKGDISNES
jgi:hypothetical protein